MRQIFLDTETTGLDPESGDRLVEVGCIEMVSRRLTGNDKHWYVNPERSSHPEALRVHGLSDEFLESKPRFAEICDDLLAYIADAELVIHNAAFDIGFLDAELRRLGLPPVGERGIKVCDSLALARELYPGRPNSLDALCKRLEVDNSARKLHGARLDAALLAEVYIRMTRGQDSLAMELADVESGTAALGAADLTQFDLPVIDPDAAEEAAHEAVLADLDKASGGQTIWRGAMA